MPFTFRAVPLEKVVPAVVAVRTSAAVVPLVLIDAEKPLAMTLL